MNLRCQILGCGKVCSESGYCERHHKNVVIDGEDPAQLRQAKLHTGDKQCPAVAQYDGANCCALITGHTNPHENHFGSRHGTWGTAAEWLAKCRNYVLPVVAPVSVAETAAPKPLLPLKLIKRKR